MKRYGFSTQINPQRSRPKSKYRLQTIIVDYPIAKQQVHKYVDSLDLTINKTTQDQLKSLKVKYRQIGGVLAGIHFQKNKIIKATQKIELDFKNQIQSYLMQDIDKYQNHKEFFKSNFSDFSKELNDAINLKNKLQHEALLLRKKLKQTKRLQMLNLVNSEILPSISQLHTSKSIKNTEPTQRSIRISTDMSSMSPILLSPILMKMGNSQPVRQSQLHKPIKSRSSNTKKLQRKQTIKLIKSLFQQRNYEKRQLTMSNFEKVLFQRRTFERLISFFDKIIDN